MVDTSGEHRLSMSMKRKRRVGGERCRIYRQLTDGRKGRVEGAGLVSVTLFTPLSILALYSLAHWTAMCRASLDQRHA